MYYCKWHIYFWLVVAIIVGLAACSKTKKPVNHFYFDTTTYIEAEINALNSSFQSFNNTIDLNGESESRSHIAADSSIFKELHALFKQANINSAVFQGEYKIDTFWILDPSSQQNIEVWNYSTANKDLKVKWLQVYSNGSLKASLSQENFLFSYDKEIYYEKGKKFSVLMWQKTLGQDTLTIFNSIEFF
jgi:hypothetical protein